MSRDNIIKALECCSKPKADCANCPMGEKRGCAVELLSKALRLIKEAEAKHGKWEKRDNEKKCSLCEFTYYSNNDYFNFCPNCGARMHRKRSEE